MRHPYRVSALTLACAAIGLVCWQRCGHAKPADHLKLVAPYTAHLTITRNIVRPDGSSASTVSTVLLARDRQGRTYERSEHGTLVQDPVGLQTLTWDEHRPVAIISRWPYWAGRTGCWATEDGQQSTFPTAQDWHNVPPSPQAGKLETIDSISDGSGRRIKARFVSENLGHKEIRGIGADGMRWTTTPLEPARSSMTATTTELWKSEELNLTLLKITSDSTHVSQHEELSALEQGTPTPRSSIRHKVTKWRAPRITRCPAESNRSFHQLAASRLSHNYPSDVYVEAAPVSSSKAAEHVRSRPPSHHASN